MEYELVVVWDTGGTNIWVYDTWEEADQAGRNMRIALGDQVFWYGVRRKAV